MATRAPRITFDGIASQAKQNATANATRSVDGPPWDSAPAPQPPAAQSPAPAVMSLDEALARIAVLEDACGKFKARIAVLEDACGKFKARLAEVRSQAAAQIDALERIAKVGAYAPVPKAPRAPRVVLQDELDRVAAMAEAKALAIAQGTIAKAKLPGAE